jgi:CheY-like chemotaxis protein
MGGSIIMSSQEGEGTVTELRIPFGISEWDEPVIDPNSFRILAGKRVLVVDENGLGIQVMTELLDSLGVRAEGVSNCQGALELLRRQEEEYDIIVVDDRVDPEWLKELRRLDFEQTKFTTFQKPYKPTQFLERLSALLGGASSAYKLQNKKYHFPHARVLICEDNAINQDVIMGVMELYDIKAVTAANGMEGIKWLEQEEFDLVIMDILMPIMDGHEATRTIRRSNKPYRDVPIIAMTANAMDEEMTVCMDDGMNGYVTKPLEIERLYHEFLKWLPVSTRSEAEEMALSHMMHDADQEEQLSNQKIRLERLGINVTEATQRFGGKYELFAKSLRKFAADLVINGMMDSAWAAEADLDELRKYIHSLKGVTANLSIKEDNRMLVEMEKTVKAGEPDIGMYQLLQQQLLKTAKGIMLLLGKEEEKKLDSGSWDECAILLSNLNELLLLAKAKECEQLIELIKAKEWENIDAELLDKICGAVEDYDYNKALTILGKLL